MVDTDNNNDNVSDTTVETDSTNDLVAQLTNKLEIQNRTIETLREKERQLDKTTKRLEKFEGIVKGQLKSYKSQLPETVVGSLEGLPLETQFALAQAWTGAAPAKQPEEPAEQAPQRPVAQPAQITPRPVAPRLQSDFEREKEELRKQGRLNGKTLSALMIKYQVR